jgi:hypothetical protein
MSKAYPTEKQIKDLLDLPTPIACDGAVIFSESLTFQLQQLSKKMLLLRKVMVALDAKLAAPNKSLSIVKKDGKA